MMPRVYTTDTKFAAVIRGLASPDIKLSLVAGDCLLQLCRLEGIALGALGYENLRKLPSDRIALWSDHGFILAAHAAASATSPIELADAVEAVLRPILVTEEP